MKQSCIRPMEKADLYAVLAIEAEANPSPWKRHDFEIFLTDPLLNAHGGVHKAWVYADPEVRGFICVAGVMDEAELQAIAVERVMWNIGIGSLLLKTSFGWAKQRNYRTVHLEVRENNLHAIEFYKRSGFKPVGRRPKYYQMSGEDAVLMKMEV